MSSILSNCDLQGCNEKGEEATVPTALNIKVNLTDGEYLTRLDTGSFLIPGIEGKECGSVCPAHPHYRCTRTAGHKSDHAAHGYRYVIKRKTVVMYARWSK